jgi:hypothetical protein
MTPRLKTFARYSALTVLLAAASLILQSQMPTGAISGGGAGSGSADPCTQSITAIPSGLHCNTVTLTQANILALDTTPFTLVPAPGAGLVVFPFATRWKFTFVTAAYQGTCTAGQYVSMWWNNNTNPFLYVFPQQFFLNIENFNWPAFANVNSTVANFSGGMFPFTQGAGNPGAGVDPANYTNVPFVLELLPGQIGCLNFGNPVTFVPVNAGTGYVVGDVVGIPASNDAFEVAAIGAGGTVTTLINNDLGALAPGTYTATNFGNVTSATVTASHGGTGYANGNTGTISGCGDGTATYQVSASSGGVVSAVTITSGTASSMYSVHSGCTTTATSGGGSGLELNTVAAAGSGLTVAVTIQPGDGTLTITTWYTVAAQ